MTARRLKSFGEEPQPYVPTPRCQGQVKVQTEHELRWRKQRYGEAPPDRVFQCSRDSVVEINEKVYCRLHGGNLVLEMYLKGELVPNERQ